MDSSSFASAKQGLSSLSDRKGVRTSTAPETKEDINDEEPRRWKCGDPYAYPIPSPEGDPWKVLLGPLIEKDRTQCDAWRDEVQNLLIFAGLFSAVVTAFVVETYQGLQEDPSDTIILLLSQIAVNLSGSQNATSKPETSFSTPQFSPSSAIIRINVYFFISLILSLTTVLVGIVSLQWLRESHAYASFTPQNTFAAIHMRSEALEKWYVPEVFSVLPLLLQLALVLFFIGVIEFLLDINISVLIPVTIIIGLTLLFLLMTTVLPTFQGFLLHHPYLKTTNEVPVPCPYKSPQSRAFQKLITSSETIFCILSFAVASTYWVLMRLLLLPKQIANTKSLRRVRDFLGAGALVILAVVSGPTKAVVLCIDKRLRVLFRFDSSESWNGFDYMSSSIYKFWQAETPFEFDVMWLSIRDNYFQSMCTEDSWLYQHREEQKAHGGIYDTTLGLYKELYKEDVNLNADVESPIFTIYHCAFELLSVNPVDGVDELNAMRTRNQYMATLLLDHFQLAPLRPFPDIMRNAPREVLIEENAFIVLHAAYYKMIELQSSSPRIMHHLAEIYFRLLGYLYSQPQQTRMVDWVDYDPPEIIFSAEELYVMSIYDAKDQPFTTQWALTLHAYFEIWDDPSFEDVDCRTSFHVHPFFRAYTWYFFKQVDKEVSEGTVSPSTLTQITITLRLINRTLTLLLLHDHDYNSALQSVLSPAALYAHLCRELLEDQPVVATTLGPLLATFARCKAVIGRQGSEFAEKFISGQFDTAPDGTVLFSEKWWGDLLDTFSDVSGPSRSGDMGRRDSSHEELQNIYRTVDSMV